MYISKYQRYEIVLRYSFFKTFYFKERQMGRVFQKLMDVLIQEAGFRVLNIPCQLSTVALLSHSDHCFSVKREPTTDTGVACRHWHDPRSVVCAKVTVVPPVTRMINSCEISVKVLIRMLNFWDQFWGQAKKILSYNKHFLSRPTRLFIICYFLLFIPINSFCIC